MGCFGGPWADTLLGQRSKPVSYTHLDVYKRQALACGRPGSRGRQRRARAGASRMGTGGVGKARRVFRGGTALDLSLIHI